MEVFISSYLFEHESRERARAICTPAVARAHLKKLQPAEWEAAPWVVRLLASVEESPRVQNEIDIAMAKLILRDSRFKNERPVLITAILKRNLGFQMIASGDGRKRMNERMDEELKTIAGILQIPESAVIQRSRQIVSDFPECLGNIDRLLAFFPFQKEGLSRIRAERLTSKFLAFLSYRKKKGKGRRDLMSEYQSLCDYLSKKSPPADSSATVTCEDGWANAFELQLRSGGAAFVSLGDNFADPADDLRFEFSIPGDQ